MHSSVVKDTFPSKTMKCDDSVHNRFVKVVHENVKSVVPFVFEKVKTDNS